MEDDFGMLNDFGKRLSKLDAQKKNRFYAIFQGFAYDFCKKYKVTIDVFNDDRANYLFAVAFERGQTKLLKDVMKALEEFEKPLDDNDVRKLLKRVLTITKKLMELSVVTDTYEKCTFLIRTMYGYYRNPFGNPVSSNEFMHVLFPIIMGSLIKKKDKIAIDTFLDEMEELLLK